MDTSQQGRAGKEGVSHTLFTVRYRLQAQASLDAAWENAELTARCCGCAGERQGARGRAD